MNPNSENVEGKDRIRTFKDRKIILTSEFDSGNAINFKKFDEGIYSFIPERDQGENYSGQAYYFKFGVENLTNIAMNITVTAIADYDDLWKGFSHSKKSPLWRYTSVKGMAKMNPSRIKATPNTISINLSLRPREKTKISNMLTVPYSDMQEIILDIDQILFPTFTRLMEIGKSSLGNLIYSMKINPVPEHWDNKERIKIMVSGSPQSNEFGDFAAIMLLQRFLKEGSEFWDEFHQHFQLEFLLFQNPDGIKLGRNMVNSKGDNIFFGYSRVEEKIPPENKAVWEYIKKSKPDLYLEFHSFFQDYKTLRPYLYPLELFRSDFKKKIYRKISNALKSFCNGGKEQVKINQKYFSDTLAYRMQEDFDTMAFQFKLHSSMEISDTKDIIWKIFTKTVKILKKNRIKILNQ